MKSRTSVHESLRRLFTLSDTTRFQIAINGEAVAENVMDVQDLAPVLLHLGRVIEGTNRIGNGEQSSVKVMVRADFQSGVFRSIT